MSALGYVIVEFNQASGQPRVTTYSGFGGDVYRDRDEAEDILTRTRLEIAQTPRRERYVLAELHVVGEPA